MNKDDLKKAWKGIFDDVSIMAMHRLLNKGIIKDVRGVIKQGKESQVLAGDPNIAIKVYAVEASNFKRMQPYLLGDRRFAHIKHDKRSIIFAWCKKEYNNLMKARKADVPCPKPLAFMKSVLVMEFLGKNYKPYPRLKDANIENPQVIFGEVVENMKKLYKAGLVHGDLSEYNILLGDKVYFIDFSQAVLMSHPDANTFLERDVHNVCKFFSRYFAVNNAKILEKVKSD